MGLIRSENARDLWYILWPIIIHLQVIVTKYNSAQEIRFCCNSSNETLINPFHATGLFRYSLKPSENQRMSDIFRGDQKRPVA